MELGFLLHLPQTLQGLKSPTILYKSLKLQCFSKRQSVHGSKIPSRKSRCMIALNIALICSKCKVGHSRLSSDGKQFRHTHTPCSQPLFRAPCEMYLLAQMVADISCGWNLWWERQMCLCFVRGAVLKFSVYFHSYFIKT